MEHFQKRGGGGKGWRGEGVEGEGRVKGAPLAFIDTSLVAEGTTDIN